MIIKKKNNLPGSLSSNLKNPKMGFGNDPDTDWTILFLSSSAILVCIVVWSIFVFLRINDWNSESVSDNATTTPAALIDKKTLSDLLSKYDLRQKTFDDLKSGRPQAADPSL